MEKFTLLLPEKWNTLSSFQQRAVTAAVLAPLAIFVIWVGGFLLTLCLIIIACLAINEYLSLVQKELPIRLIAAYGACLALSLILATYLPFEIALLTLFIWALGLRELAKRLDPPVELNTMAWMGVFYIGLPMISIVWLRKVGMNFSPFYPTGATFMLFFHVWAVDIAAYLVGRKLGGPKLAPAISPNKTWSGFIAGTVAGAAVLGFAALAFGFSRWPFFLVIGVLLSVIAQGGDLFESLIKRRAGVKDSGQIIPGHGGILDRIDALLFTAPVFALFLYALS